MTPAETTQHRDDAIDAGEARLCGNCIYRAGVTCYRAPPVVHVIMQQAKQSGKVVTGEQSVVMQQVPYSFRPLVAESDIGCESHRFGDEGTDLQEIAAILDAFHVQIQGITKYLGVPSGRVVVAGDNKKEH